MTTLAPGIRRISRVLRNPSAGRPFCLHLVIVLAACRHESRLPKLFTVPNTQLIDEHGRRDAKRFRSNDRWIFLTGDRQAIVDLSVKGFKLAAGAPQPGSEPLLHSSKFAVADKNGVIRENHGGKRRHGRPRRRHDRRSVARVALISDRCGWPCRCSPQFSR